MAQPEIRPSDQMLMVGKNGQGKSVLALYHFCWETNAQKVFGNVKMDPDVEPFLIKRYGAENVSVARGDVAQLDFRKRILLYNFEHSNGPECIAETNRLYARLLRRQHLTMLLDECAGPTTSSMVPPALAAYLQQGRSRNLRHIGCTQRPVRIAKVLISEASHIVWFPRGFNATDRKFMANEMGIDDEYLRVLAGQVLQPDPFGDFGHIHYETRKVTLHRRPSVPRP
jgi:hypothetical protein